MDETILTARQKYILNIINQADGVLREEIQEKIAKLYPVSKPTTIRDINILLKNKLVKAEGKARATKYLSKILNPLLRKNVSSQHIIKGFFRQNSHHFRAGRGSDS